MKKDTPEAMALRWFAYVIGTCLLFPLIVIILMYL